MKFKLNHTVAWVALGIAVSGCDAYLDKMPDQRTEINNVEKVSGLLTSAYPTLDPMMLYEHRTDNVSDNGSQYGTAERTLEENYFWKDITDASWDSPHELWDRCYKAIATANQALEAIAAMGETPALLPYKGEAFLCRAYAHFLLANTFCMPYSAATAKKELGIPYVEEPETVIGKTYTRGTLQEVYSKLESDIEAGLALINDNAYKVPKYHFNRKAACAFAARFYLFVGKPEKTIAYANEVLGDNPSAQLRDLVNNYAAFSQLIEWTYQYHSADEATNLLIVPTTSLWGRFYNQRRYGHSEAICRNATYWAGGPWGEKALTAFERVFGGSGYPVKYLPMFDEIFEITNQISRTGQPHVVAVPFTADETLLCRAEAYVWQKNYEAAAQDLSYWLSKKGGKAVTSRNIIDYFTRQANAEKAAIAEGKYPEYLRQTKDLNPLNFTIENKDQEMMLQGVLHMRRLETLFGGSRWLDIRRYGIEVEHNVENADPIRLPADDKRRALQLPSMVLASGLPANPR